MHLVVEALFLGPQLPFLVSKNLKIPPAGGAGVDVMTFAPGGCQKVGL